VADFSIIAPRGAGVLRRMRQGLLSAYPPSDARSMTNTAVRDLAAEPPYRHEGAMAVQRGTEDAEVPSLLGAGSWLPLDQAHTSADLSRIAFPEDYTYLSVLGSLTPGGGTGLLRELRRQRPETGILLNSLPLPNTHRFYESLGFEPTRSRALENFDYVLPPGRPFARAQGGAVRAAGRMPTRVEPEPRDVVPRDYLSDEDMRRGDQLPDRPRPEPGTDPREDMIQEAMEDYLRGARREAYPDEFGRGGRVDPLAKQLRRTAPEFARGGRAWRHG
jgi:hypothetical protein